MARGPARTGGGASCRPSSWPLVSHEFRTPLDLAAARHRAAGRKRRHAARTAAVVLRACSAGTPSGCTGWSNRCSISPAWRTAASRTTCNRVDAAALTRTVVVADFRRTVDRGRLPVDARRSTSAHALSRSPMPPSLAHALWNLLDNAVKYSPAAPPIRVSVRAPPDGASPSPCATSGLGIPAHERTRHLQAIRARRSRPARLGIKGTGLGLAMVYAHRRGARRRDRARIGGRRRAARSELVFLPRPRAEHEPWPAS